jgi:thiol peroxidase
MIERTGIITMKGDPLTLMGAEIKTGDKAPDFKAIDIEMKEVTLKDSSGLVRLISVVPSLDTTICDLQTQRFESEAAKVSSGVIIYTISMDLPFAQKRYCGAHSISILKTLSDHREASFGVNYGVLIKELRLLSRSIFIIDTGNIVRYVEYVKEMGTHPDYNKALEALKTVTK